MGGWKGEGVYLDLVGEHSAPIQGIYYLVPYTDLLASEGTSAFQTSLLFILFKCPTDQWVKSHYKPSQ